MERLYETMYRLLENTTSEFHRYIYDRINWDNRMLGLVGPRGVGKTTRSLIRPRLSAKAAAHSSISMRFINMRDGPAS